VRPTVIESIQEALLLLESLGYHSDDIHENLFATLKLMRGKHRDIGMEEV